MPINGRNRNNVLAEAVSLEMWSVAADSHPFYNLHADVVFQPGDVGSKEETSDVIFKLEIKKAELVLNVPDEDRCVSIPNSVSRDTPSSVGTITSRATSDLNASVGAMAKVGSALSVPELSFGLSGERTLSEQREVVEVKELKTIDVLQSLDRDRNYVWVMTPSSRVYLTGRPWDAKATPRLMLKDKRATRRGLGPDVTMSLMCKRSDIIITDIRLKKKRWLFPMPIVANKNKKIAAEAYIKNALLSQSVDDADYINEHCLIELASDTISIGE